MPKERPPRAKQHDWLPHQEEGKVYCGKCGIVVSTNDARRGAGPCTGEGRFDEGGSIETQELSSDDIRQRIPKARLFMASGQDHGKCNGCGKQIAELPFNSRLAMVACGNNRCTLYRQRLRFITCDEQDRTRREIEEAARIADEQMGEAQVEAARKVAEESEQGRNNAEDHSQGSEGAVGKGGDEVLRGG